MRISVDAHAIGCHLTGNEVYIRNLLREFARFDEGTELIAYISKRDAPQHLPKNVSTRWVSENPYVRLGWDMPLHLRRDKPDVLHVQYTGPLHNSTPTVVTVHDVSYLDHPEYFTSYRATQLRLTVGRTLKSAARVLTPSEFSKREILRHYPWLAADRVVVVPNAVSSRFRPVERNMAQKRVSERFGIPGPFVLTVGDLQPRKNHMGLLAAFEDAVAGNPDLPHHLVFVGKETWYSKVLHQAVKRSRVAGRVHFAGFVEDEELVNFYGACDLFVFPSFYEGFGLPILEAMASCRAVACSNTTAMPEVADSAGILFDPSSRHQMTRAMVDVLSDAELRNRLERLGHQWASNFSWKASAEKTMDVYCDAAGKRRVRANVDTQLAAAARTGS